MTHVAGIQEASQLTTISEGEPSEDVQHSLV